MNTRLQNLLFSLAFGSGACPTLFACSDAADEVPRASSAGAPSISGGTPSVSGGTPSISGGTPSISGGTPSVSGGTPSVSGGTPSVSGSGGAGGTTSVPTTMGGAAGGGGSPTEPNSPLPDDGLDRDPSYSAGTPPLPTSADDYPKKLSETGLYANIQSSVFAADVRLFKPQFELWSDSAEKRRWFYLPKGEQINTEDMDNWEFPVGTKVWKEFARDDTRVETRILWRFKPGGRGWIAISYIWNEDQSDAVAAPLGQTDALNTTHDVPSVEACGGCHADRKDFLLGFSAIQLAHDEEGTNLTDLTERGLLSHPPTGRLEVPGLEVERRALGYLHANCGSCHRASTSAAVRADLRMWLLTDQLDAVTSTDAYTYLVNQETVSDASVFETRVTGKAPAESEMLRRMLVRGGDDQMPPIGSDEQDEAGANILRAWINLLPAQ